MFYFEGKCFYDGEQTVMSDFSETVSTMDVNACILTE